MGLGGRAAERLRYGAGGNWTAVSAGGRVTCGIDDLAQLECWGDAAAIAADHCFGGATHGLLGRHSPGVTSGWLAVSVGYMHSCGILMDGQMACWGSSHDCGGAAYNGQAAGWPEGHTWKAVAAGDYHSCGIETKRGALHCWGDDQWGQATVPDTSTHRTRWVAVSAGGSHTCGLDSAGFLACFGLNEEGQTDVPTLSNANTWGAVACGAAFSCGIDSAGNMLCWCGREAAAGACSRHAGLPAPRLPG